MGWMLWIHVRSPWETALFAAAQMLELDRGAVLQPSARIVPGSLDVVEVHGSRLVSLASPRSQRPLTGTECFSNRSTLNGNT